LKVAIIPARGGSKRIPRKNIRCFAGKPVMAYSIEAAARCKLFDRIVVSTDDEKIAAVAREHGAETPFVRPSALADDYTDTMAVVAHAVGWLERHQGCNADAICCLYATAPFVRSEDIVAGWRLLETGQWRFVFSAAAFAAPVARAFSLEAGGGVRMLFPQNFAARSQDIPEALHDAAQFYWGTRQAWLGDEPIFGADSTVVRLPAQRVQDIDTEEDWIRAEAMYAMLDSPGELK